MATFEVISGAAIGGGGSSYLVYKATIAQLTGTGDDPTPTLFTNTLGDTVVWTRFSAGIYEGTISNGAFTSGKTIFPPFGNNQYVIMGIGNSLPFDYGYSVSYAGINKIQVNVYKTSDYSSVDLYTALLETPILIQVEVYPSV
jgi:hypothetical protein